MQLALAHKPMNSDITFAIPQILACCPYSLVYLALCDRSAIGRHHAHNRFIYPASTVGHHFPFFGFNVCASFLSPFLTMRRMALAARGLALIT